MERDVVLGLFNSQMRRDPPPSAGVRVEVDHRVTRVVSDGAGWSGVVWSQLADDDADDTIAAQIQRFSSIEGGWEWKWYSYDGPSDLPARLQSAGFAPDAGEAVLVAELSEVDLAAAPPPGVELTAVVDRDGVNDLVAVHDEVFGGRHAGVREAALAASDDNFSVAAVVARAHGAPIAAGRIELPPGRDFAGLWGGGVLPAWRGKGVFRSLVGYRAALARQRGYRYLHVDASPDSQPIFERLGFTKLAETTPFRRSASTTWSEPGSAATPV